MEQPSMSDDPGRKGPQSLDDFFKSMMREAFEEMNLRRKRLMTYDEAAEYCSVSKGTVYNWVAEGKIKPVYLTRIPLLDVEDIHRLISDHKAS